MNQIAFLSTLPKIQSPVSGYVRLNFIMGELLGRIGVNQKLIRNAIDLKRKSGISLEIQKSDAEKMVSNRSIGEKRQSLAAKMLRFNLKEMTNCQPGPGS